MSYANTHGRWKLIVCMKILANTIYLLYSIYFIFPLKTHKLGDTDFGIVATEYYNSSPPYMQVHLTILYVYDFTKILIIFYLNC